MDGELDLLIDGYLAVLKVERGLGPATIEAYARDLARFARFWGETPRPLDALDRQVVTGFLSALTEEGLSARSQARYLSALRGFFKHCVEERHLTRNPCELVGSPRVGRASSRATRCCA
jgi:integrase/recombinase XerD